MSNPNAITLESVVSWHPEQVGAEIDGEVVVMGLAQGKYVGLDDVGSTLWKLLEQPQPVRDLCAQLERLYQGDPAAISSDVLAFLGDLRELEIIRIADDESSIQTGA
jgi:hypothetical protein